jgi:8-oxo-dGTP diphosphatase
MLGIDSNAIEELSLRYITLRWTNEEIRQNYYFFANLKPSVDENLMSNEGISQWFPLQEITALKMPLTAKYVMEHYCTIGRYTSEMYVGITHCNEVHFTKLPET